MLSWIKFMSYLNIVCHLNVQLVHYKNKVARYCAILVCSGLSLVSSLTYALGISDRDFYQTGLAFYRAGQLNEAANNWQALARDNQSQDNEIKKQAAFAAILATLAWEQLENSNAYTTWSEAIRLYLQANTTWEQERLALKQRITGNRVALQQLTSDVVLSIEPFEQLLLDMDENYALTDYQGPRTGLQKNDAEAALDVMQYVMPTQSDSVAIPIENTPLLPLVPETQSPSLIDDTAVINKPLEDVSEQQVTEPKVSEQTVERTSVITKEDEPVADVDLLQTTPSSTSELETNLIEQPTFSGRVIPLESN
jgi:hypothetical protein